MILLAQLEKKLSTYIHKPIAFMSAAFILFVFEVSFFTSTTSFNLDIHSHGFQDADVGIISLLYTTGYLLACIYFPRLIDRFSSVTLMRIAVGILIFFYLIIDYLETAWLVFPIRTIWGSLTGFLFTCTIVILSELIKPKYKSTIIAILTSFVALGSALGAFLVDLTGVISLAPHLVAAMCLFLALPFFKNLYPIVSKASSVKSKNPFTTILILPVILFISLGLGVGKGTLTSFLSIYGLVAFSLSVKEAALLLSFSSMGGVFLPPLFGVLGDKMGHLKIIIFLSILAVICLGSLLIPTGIGHLYWSVFFILGGILPGIYSLSLAIITTTQSREIIPDAVAGFSFIGKIGALSGVAVTGIIMTEYGNIAFLYSLLVGSLLIAISATYAHARKKF